MTPDIKRLIIFLFVLIAIQGGVDYYLFRTIKKYEAFYGAWFSKVLRTVQTHCVYHAHCFVLDYNRTPVVGKQFTNRKG